MNKLKNLEIIFPLDQFPTRLPRGANAPAATGASTAGALHVDQLRSYMVNKMKRIFLGLITLMLLGSGVGYAEVNYTGSAHGNADPDGYGVLRTSTNQYARGNCAHCHEQHASIDGGTPPDPTPNTGDAVGPDGFCLLALNFDTTPSIPYDQDDNACFFCHCYPTATTYQATPNFYNYSYSKTFGGDPNDSVDNIMEAFNLASYHNLEDVIDYADSVVAWPFTADNNPCCVCHNVHIARRNKANPGNPAYTAISKPSAHDELWGDSTDNTEKMCKYTYQAPYHTPGTPSYEPANDNTTTGSNMPDYVSFCQDCHVNDVDGVGPLSAIDWSIGGDKHGQRDGGGWKEAPYNYDPNNFVLACTDCHEPHGSTSYSYLIRGRVNGGATDFSADTRAKWNTLCDRCHMSQLMHKGSRLCSECHYHGSVKSSKILF